MLIRTQNYMIININNLYVSLDITPPATNNFNKVIIKLNSLHLCSTAQDPFVELKDIVCNHHPPHCKASSAHALELQVEDSCKNRKK